MFDRDALPAVLFGLLVAFIIAFLVFSFPKCKRGHTDIVHHDAYTSFMMIGKIMIPQHHNAYNASEFVCDERCHRNDAAPECR